MGDELAEGRRLSNERGHQLTGRAALLRGRMGKGAARAASLGSTNALSQGDGFRRGCDLQRLGQPCPTGGVDLQSGAGRDKRQVHTHQAPVGLLRQRIERQPSRERGARLLQLPIGLLPGGGPLAEQLQAHLPLALLQPHPLVKGSFLAQPEAVEERTARQGKRVLDLGDQGGALWLSGDCGEPLDLCVGLLRHPHVQLQRGLRVQTEQLMLTEQMGVLGISVVEQAA